MSTAEAVPPASPPRRLTPADLLAMPNESGFELVDGQLAELNVGFESNHVASMIHFLLCSYVYPRGLGWVLPQEQGYQCFPHDPTMVRRPDTSFIHIDRLPVTNMPKAYCRVAPDLAVEVISPHDLASELSKKVRDYLNAGVKLVWVVDPDDRQVFIYGQLKAAAILSQEDEITGESVIPGFRCQVSAFFELPRTVS